MSWAQKKRGMMRSRPSGQPVIPSGYITDGLLLFLDGLQVESASKWVDCVNGVEFTLHNAIKAANGVTFAGDNTSYGESSATFQTGVTIEAAYSLDNASQNVGIFGQNRPSSGDNTIILLHTYSSQYIFCCWQTARRSYKKSPLESIEIVSAAIYNGQGGNAVKNGVQITSTGNSYANYPSGGITGSLIATHNGSSTWMDGTLHALRIYNRALSVAEMQANQALDNQRYGLGITFPT